MHTATTTYKAFNQRLIGRFLSPDPYGQFYSAYTGMGNNPVNLIDPSGGYVKHWRIKTGTSQKSYPRFGEGGGTLIDIDFIYVFIDFGPGPTGGGGGNGGSTGPGCGSGGGSGSQNSGGRLSGPPPDPDGEEEHVVVLRGEPDEYGTDSEGDLNVNRGNVLVKKGVIRNESSEPIKVKPENGEWETLNPGEEYDKKYDGVKAHGKIIKVSAASRIGITVVDKLHESESGFRYYVKDMSRNIRWNKRSGRINNRSQNTFFDENNPPIGWEE
ncbi:MAG: hypothetical protein PF448_06875 [Bacteroidales bacterium]|nr:hypothetical protein [Bacteroidales bacterium]